MSGRLMIERDAGVRAPFDKISFSIDREAIGPVNEPAESWFADHVEKQLAKLADSAEFRQVSELEARLAQAESDIANAQGTIEKVRANTLNEILTDDAAAEAVARIGHLNRAIEAAGLVTQSVTPRLTQAREARDALALQACEALYYKVKADVSADGEKAQDAFCKIVEKAYSPVAQARAKVALIPERFGNAWVNAQAASAFVLACSGKHSRRRG